MSDAYIRDGENILCRSERSKAAVVITWLSVPSIFLVYYLFTLPARIQKWLTDKVSDAVVDAMGDPLGDVPDLGFFTFEIPTFVKVLIAIPIVLLVLAWLGWALVSTRKMMGNEILHTDARIIARSAHAVFECPIDDIYNVILEQSIGGRLFGYGNLNISAKRGSVTVRCIKDPVMWRDRLLKQSGNIT